MGRHLKCLTHQHAGRQAEQRAVAGEDEVAQAGKVLRQRAEQGLIEAVRGIDVEWQQPGLAASATPAYLARCRDSVVPAVGAFFDLRKAAPVKAAQKPFLGFGDPDFAVAAGDLRGLAAIDKRCRADKAIGVTEFRELPRLPETASELKGIAAALKATPDSVVLGAAATPSPARRRPCARRSSR